MHPTQPTLPPLDGLADRGGPLTTSLAFRDDSVVLTLAGSVEGAAAGDLATVGRRLDHRGLQSVVVDAAAVTRVDLDGLHEVLALRPDGARLRLRRPSRCVRALVDRALAGGLLVGWLDGAFGEVRPAARSAGGGVGLSPAARRALRPVLA